MVSSRAAERFDALSTRTGELDDRSNRSLPGRPRPHIRHGLLLAPFTITEEVKKKLYEATLIIRREALQQNEGRN